MTEKQYGKLVEELSPKSPIGKDCIKAFVIGGLICTLGQVLMTLYGSWGLDKQDAGTAAGDTGSYWGNSRDPEVIQWSFGNPWTE